MNPYADTQRVFQISLELRIEPIEARQHLARTAQRRQVVAFRTFLRTLLHELCHHLDYTLFELGYSFHTQGFYRRESNLMRQVLDNR